MLEEGAGQMSLVVKSAPPPQATSPGLGDTAASTSGSLPSASLVPKKQMWPLHLH